MYPLYNTMGSSSRKKQKRRFDWNKIYSVPEDEDTLEEVESGYSLAVHSARTRKLRLRNASSDDSGKAMPAPLETVQIFSKNPFLFQ